MEGSFPSLRLPVCGRGGASRSFRAGMLMYGEGPSWREVWRWMRESDPTI